MVQVNNIVAYTMRISIVTIFCNVILAVIKFVAGFIGNSSALISDAVHSLSDVLSTFVVIVGVRMGNKESDKDHPYGHERLECIAALILAGLLLATGIGIAFVACEKIYTGMYTTMAIPTTLALIVAIASIFIKEGMYWYTFLAAKKINSDMLRADAWHHRSDALSSLGSLAGIGGAQLGYPICEPLAAFVICYFIIKVSYDICRDAVSKLVDTAVDEETNRQISTTVLSHDAIIAIDDLKTRMFGNRIYVDVEIAVLPHITLIAAHQIAESIHDMVEKNFPDVKHCMVHVNPCQCAKKIEKHNVSKKCELQGKEKN